MSSHFFLVSDISQNKRRIQSMQWDAFGFQVDCCISVNNFDCCFLFSITAASVEVWCAIAVQQKNFYYPPSPQNHCECVITAIMFYQAVKFNQIKNPRDTTVCWFYFFSSQMKNIYYLSCERNMTRMPETTLTQKQIYILPSTKLVTL